MFAPRLPTPTTWPTVNPQPPPSPREHPMRCLARQSSRAQWLWCGRGAGACEAYDAPGVCVCVNHLVSSCPAQQDVCGCATDCASPSPRRAAQPSAAGRRPPAARRRKPAHRKESARVCEDAPSEGTRATLPKSAPLRDTPETFAVVDRLNVPAIEGGAEANEVIATHGAGTHRVAAQPVESPGPIFNTHGGALTRSAAATTDFAKTKYVEPKTPKTPLNRPSAGNSPRSVGWASL